MVDRKAWSSSAPPLQLSAVRAVEQAVEHIEDDRDNLQPDDAVLLIVEDDTHYARVLCDLSRDTGFKVLVAQRGAEALGAGPRVSSYGRCLWMFSCRTCWAGRCSII